MSRPGYGVTVAGFNRPPSSPGRASSQELASGERTVDEPGRPNRGSEPAADRQSGASLQRRHAHFAWRADHSDRLSGSRQCAHGRERHGTDCPARGAEQRLDRDRDARRDSERDSGADAGQAAANHDQSRQSHPSLRRLPLLSRLRLSGLLPPRLTPWSLTGLSAPARARAPCPISPAPSPEAAASRSRRSLAIRAGGLNPDGTPNTTSRQFQAGLSVTGQGATQNATLFVMTSAISNAPNIGFTQAGGFTGVTMRNHGRMVRAGRRRRVVGDAELGAQHCADHEWGAHRKLRSEQYEHKPAHRNRFQQSVVELCQTRQPRTTRSIR